MKSTRPMPCEASLSTRRASYSWHLIVSFFNMPKFFIFLADHTQVIGEHRRVSADSLARGNDYSIFCFLAEDSCLV